MHTHSLLSFFFSLAKQQGMDASLCRPKLLLIVLYIFFSFHIAAESRCSRHFVEDSTQLNISQEFPSSGRHTPDEYGISKATSQPSNQASNKKRRRRRARLPPLSSQIVSKSIKDFQAPPQLVTISRPPGVMPMPNPPYVYNRNAGKGTTVYLIGKVPALSTIGDQYLPISVIYLL